MKFFGGSCWVMTSHAAIDSAGCFFVEGTLQHNITIIKTIDKILCCAHLKSPKEWGNWNVTLKRGLTYRRFSTEFCVTNAFPTPRHFAVWRVVSYKGKGSLTKWGGKELQADMVVCKSCANVFEDLQANLDFHSSNRALAHINPAKGNATTDWTARFHTQSGALYHLQAYAMDSTSRKRIKS